MKHKGTRFYSTSEFHVDPGEPVPEFYVGIRGDLTDGAREYADAVTGFSEYQRIIQAEEEERRRKEAEAEKKRKAHEEKIKEEERKRQNEIRKLEEKERKEKELLIAKALREAQAKAKWEGSIYDKLDFTPPKICVDSLRVHVFSGQSCDLDGSPFCSRKIKIKHKEENVIFNFDVCPTCHRIFVSPEKVPSLKKRFDELKMNCDFVEKEVLR